MKDQKVNEIRIIIVPILKSTIPGLTIISIPIKPITTADHLLIPTFSERKITDIIVTNKGPVKVRLITSAKGRFLNAIKIATIEIKPAKTLFK